VTPSASVDDKLLQRAINRDLRWQAHSEIIQETTIVQVSQYNYAVLEWKIYIQPLKTSHR